MLPKGPSINDDPPPLSRYVLNVSLPSNRTILTATTPYPLTERISCYLRYSLQGNILIASSHDIHVYSTKSSGNKISHIIVPSQCLLLTAPFLCSRKQYDLFTLKHHRHYHQLLQRWVLTWYQSSYGNDVSGEAYTLPSAIPKHLEFT